MVLVKSWRGCPIWKKRSCLVSIIITSQRSGSKVGFSKDVPSSSAIAIYTFQTNLSIKNIFCFSNTTSVPDNLRSTHSEKTKNAMKAPRSIKRITFNPSEANPGETLYVHAPKMNKNEVLVPGSLALRFNIDLSGGDANNFLVQNVSRALVSQMAVKFGGTILEETVDYDVYKIFSDLFLPGERRDNMVPEGIQSEDLCKNRSGAGDAKTSGVEAEKN